MQVIENLAPSYAAPLHRLYRQIWWGVDRTEEEAALCLQGSQLTLGVLDDAGQLIAFTRVLTDGIFKAFIFDVVVDQAHRGQGLGDVLINHVRQHPSLARVQHLELYCRNDVLDFYLERGFQEKNGEMHLMRLTTR
jgi:GNAT superfamily N-acetyltransferase